MSGLTLVEGWSLDTTGDEPLVRDIDLAERLGYEKPRDVRKLIKRLIDRGIIAVIHQRSTVERTSQPHGGEREYTVTEYWLTEGQAMHVCMQSKTPNAITIQKEVVNVFMAVRKGNYGQLALLERTVGMAIERSVGPIIHQVSVGFAQMLSTQAKVLEQVRHVDVKVEALDQRMTAIENKGRKEPKKADVMRHIDFVAYRYRGMCPHCDQVEIVADGKRTNACHIDHFYSRNRATISDIWPICDVCNRRKETAPTRAEYDSTFATYMHRFGSDSGPLLRVARA